MAKLTKPTDLYKRLNQHVIDQDVALRQISVSLYKHVNRVKAGNILLIGNSGTGKTTIMKTIESCFAADDELRSFTNVIRMNANVVADEERLQPESSLVIERLIQNAYRLMGKSQDPKKFKMLIENGVVFLDEIDKIRGEVGGKTNARGILAQEALLTLIEGETLPLPFSYKNEAGALVRLKVPVETNRILFICGGAFEGLYDTVYRRVAGGEHRDKLVREFVVEDRNQELEEKIHFSLNAYLRYEDLFDYGMTPQFLGRFDDIIVLKDLSVHALMKIFVEPTDSLFREAKRYFASFGIELRITKDALRLLAERAFENNRLGARALRGGFKRLMREFEFDPSDSYLVQREGDQKVLTISEDLVARTV